MIISPDYFFKNHQSIAQKQYEALRMFYYEKVPAKVVAKKIGYTYRGFTTICSNFRAELRTGNHRDLSSKNQKREEKILIVSGL